MHLSADQLSSEAPLANAQIRGNKTKHNEYMLQHLSTPPYFLSKKAKNLSNFNCMAQVTLLPPLDSDCEAMVGEDEPQAAGAVSRSRGGWAGGWVGG